MSFIVYGVLGFTLLSVMSLCWFFLTTSGSNVRLMMADTLITTQHREWAKY
ncbi:phosphodiester glycosidase family protein, partial [Paenibacillus sp. TAF58]